MIKWLLRSWRRFSRSISENRRAADRLRLGVDQADAARVQFDWEAAISGYEAYLIKRPRDLGVRLRLARAYSSAGRPDVAEIVIRRAIALRPDKIELQRLLSDLIASRNGGVGVEVAWSPYQSFRSTYTTSAPPVRLHEPLTFLVDARGHPPVSIRETVLSLRGMADGAWNAIILIEPNALEHSVASLQLEDPRVVFVTAGALNASFLNGPVAVTQAGVVVDRHCMGWMLEALSMPEISAVFADHDRSLKDWRSGFVWFDPAFQSAPHTEDVRSNARPPAIIAFRTSPSVELRGDAASRRQYLLDEITTGRVAHVPLLLSTVLELGPVDNMHAMKSAKGSDWATIDGDDSTRLPNNLDTKILDRILVVIPTRDEAKSLATMVNSLSSTAVDPTRIDFLIADNRSVETETHNLLSAWSRLPSISIMPVDEPFNWSRLNNLAVRNQKQDIFVFANNDMEMLTKGWDRMLRDRLNRPRVGVAGARLIYPSGKIQHAGMVLGAAGGAPLHEGMGASPDLWGPLGRWRRVRPAAAVTGAFMAVTREVFFQVGGFEAMEMPVSCSDVDFCLRARQAGLAVLFMGDIELVHHESQTRGHANTPEKIQWLESELVSLSNIWGDDLLHDPSRNPHWVAHEARLFHGFRQPSKGEVMEYIRRSNAWGANREGAYS